MSETLEAPTIQEVYSWGGGFTPKVKAAVFKAAWDALADELGRPPRPADLVAAARQPGHSLHDCFTWDVDAAAAAHWIEQAQALIRHLRITYAAGPARNMPMRALFRVRVDDERHYVAAGVALGNLDLRDQVMHAALLDLRAYTAKYQVFLTAIGAADRAAALEAAIEAAVADDV